MPLLAGAEPYHHDGGPLGALLVHGYTGSPQSLRPWAEHLAAAGLTVSLPRLPGHGTTWQELALTRWPDWYAAAERELLALRERCAHVVVMGLSMGGTLALRLAEEHGPAVDGVVVVNPSLLTRRPAARLLPVAARVVRSLPGIGSDIAKPGVVELAYDRNPLASMASLAQLWRVVRADLGAVTQPLLLLRSAVDHVVEPDSAALLLRSVSSTDVREQVLPRSFHVATLDHDAPTVFAESLAFARRLAAAPAAGSAPAAPAARAGG